jgi:hypothetical protein
MMEVTELQIEPVCILCREKPAHFSMPGSTDKLEIDCRHCGLSYRVENVVQRGLDLPVPIEIRSALSQLARYENDAGRKLIISAALMERLWPGAICFD